MNTTPIEETEYIRKMYDSQLQSQKDTLTQDYQQALSNIDATKKVADQQLDKSLNATAVEAQRAQKNYNEVQNAYGLSSGAMAQARLAQDNQLQADLTTLRTAHETADAELERERTLLGQQYAAAISQAQAENDMAKAQALYAEAKERDAQLTAKQQSAAQLMAQAGDFSLYGQAYGLTPDQISALTATFQAEKQKEAASLMAQAGDFSLYKQIYGLTDDQLATLQIAFSGASDTRGSPTEDPGFNTIDNGGLSDEEIIELQTALGNVGVDALWGPESQRAAMATYGTSDAREALKIQKRRDEINAWVAMIATSQPPAGLEPTSMIKNSNFLQNESERVYAYEVLNRLQQ